jgi:hypothetical protein
LDGGRFAGNSLQWEIIFLHYLVRIRDPSEECEINYDNSVAFDWKRIESEFAQIRNGPECAPPGLNRWQPHPTIPSFAGPDR